MAAAQRGAVWKTGAENVGSRSGRPCGTAGVGYARLVRAGRVLAICASMALVTPARGAFDGTIDTYVGGGNGDGGPAIDALIDPRGLAFGPGGVVFVADGRNNRVRRIDVATGIISTVAGSGESGFGGDGGIGQNAKLSLPMDVAVDGSGNLYIADFANNRIRKLSPNGIISTLAGNGSASFGGDGGLATQAALSNPWGVAVGPDGYVYIADHGNSRIRRVGPPGCGPTTCIITTVAGSGVVNYSGDGGPALAAALRNPSDVAFDSAGNMLISDFNNNRVRRVVNGIIDTFAGGGSIGSDGSIGDGGPAVGAVLRFPTQISAGPNGTIFIADNLQRRLRRVQNGAIATVAGTGTAGSGGDGGPATLAEMYFPYGVAVHPSGDLWIATTTTLARSQHNRIRTVDGGGTINAVVGGGIGNGAAATDVLVDPRGIDARPGAGLLPDLYLADGVNNVVRYVDGRDATTRVLAGTGEAGYSGDGGWATSARMNKPLDVAVDRDGNVYVADTFNNVVRRVDRTGLIGTVAGNGSRGFAGDGGPAGAARLASPTGIALDRDGNLYIADSENYRVRKVTNGIISTIAGTGQSGYGGDGGPATAALLTTPWDVVVGADGTVYIADHLNSRIRRVTPDGIMTTYAGTGITGFTGDGGPATSARLYRPSLLALDNANNLFIADNNNLRVRVVAGQTGIIETVAGNGQSGAGGDGGPAKAASFSTPSGIAVDPSGAFLFVSAYEDALVRMVTFGGALPPSSPTFTATWTPQPTSFPASPTRTRTPTITQTPTRTGTATRSPTGGGASTGSVAGRVTYYSNQSAVAGVRVDFTGPQALSSATNSSGNYAFTGAPLGNWTIRPSKAAGLGNSISSLDAARILQVISGMIAFTPLQRLACDVTGDGNLSALDAVRILQYSAGLIGRFPLAQSCDSDWLFYPVPDAFQFQQITPPSIGSGCQPGSIALSLTSGAAIAANQHFAGIAIGDCTGNWGQATGGALRQIALPHVPSATVLAGRLRAAPGGRYRLPLYVQTAAPFHALDLILLYDADLFTPTSVRPHGSAADALIAVADQDPGTLGISLASGTPLAGNSGAVLVVELSGGRNVTATGFELLDARVDEQPARLSMALAE